MTVNKLLRGKNFLKCLVNINFTEAYRMHLIFNVLKLKHLFRSSDVKLASSPKFNVTANPL